MQCQNCDGSKAEIFDVCFVQHCTPAVVDWLCHSCPSSQWWHALWHAIQTMCDAMYSTASRSLRCAAARHIRMCSTTCSTLRQLASAPNGGTAAAASCWPLQLCLPAHCHPLLTRVPQVSSQASSTAAGTPASSEVTGHTPAVALAGQPLSTQQPQGHSHSTPPVQHHLHSQALGWLQLACAHRQHMS